MLYNKKTQKKVTITGKHSKRIISGAWNNKNYLAIGSEDRQVSVYDGEGESVVQFSVKYDPVQVVVGLQASKPNN